jgi:hypothetical protein
MLLSISKNEEHLSPAAAFIEIIWRRPINTGANVQTVGYAASFDKFYWIDSESLVTEPVNEISRQICLFVKCDELNYLREVQSL